MSRYSGAPASRMPFMLMASADRMEVVKYCSKTASDTEMLKALHKCSNAAVHTHMSGSISTMQHAAAVLSRP